MAVPPDGAAWPARRASSPQERQGADVDGPPIGVVIGLLCGLGGGLAGALAYARLRAQSARGIAQEILDGAHREAETIRKEADLQAKAEAFRRREAVDAEIEEARRELR